MFSVKSHVDVLRALGYYSGPDVDRWTPSLSIALQTLTKAELGYSVERRLTAADTLPSSLKSAGDNLILAKGKSLDSTDVAAHGTGPTTTAQPAPVLAPAADLTDVAQADRQADVLQPPKIGKPNEKKGQ